MANALRYVNPYSGISANYVAGLNQIADTLSAIGPEPTIEQVVTAVYNYVTSTYSMSPDALGEQTTKFMITELINGYLNYNLLYSPEQTQFIHQLIAGTIVPGNPQDILQHITDVEEQIAQSNLSTADQAPLLYATAIGKSAYSYWATIVTTPGDWAIFTGGFTPPITKFPYWVAAAMQGTLVGLNLFNLQGESDATKIMQTINATEGRLILLTLFGALTINSGKVVYNWQQREQSKNIF